ncbi:MAG: hypothetical protein J6Y28_01940 [Acholeplasmatales bacterium]|nr:hypothetical protein [Acholeplasmatales bacterium]
MTEKDYYDIELMIGYEFSNKSLLKQAFTRKSYSMENGGEDNEVLEFYGDTVLSGSVIRIFDILFCESRKDYYVSKKTEAELTELKKNLVSRTMLSKRIDYLGLSEYLIMGKSDILNNVQNEASVKEDLFEAIIGAVAIDCKFESSIIDGVINTMLDPVYYIYCGFDFDVINYIQKVQEWNQKFNGELPEYIYSIDDYSDKIECTILIPNPSGEGILDFEDISRNKADAFMKAAEKAYWYLYRNGFIKEEKMIDVAGKPDMHNPVEQLNILATKGYIESPDYTFIETFDDNGNPKWECICKIKGYEFEVHNHASSKKEAKKLCAYQVYKLLLNEKKK